MTGVFYGWSQCHDSKVNVKENSLFELGRNCWHVKKACHAALLIDNANYYRALHEAICRARHSIFVFGWDIDSRIELLRGDEAKNSRYPIRFLDLIRWKACQTPDLAIYIDRWDFFLYLMIERENFSKIKWRIYTPANVHYCMDGVIPVGACHHQKLVVIDDAIVFSGGMDIARARWDQRPHLPQNKHRIDPAGTYQPHMKEAFGPHHDVQILVAGPVVRPLAELVRERWHLANGYYPVALREQRGEGLPDVWPPSVVPDLTDVDMAIALTLPPIYGNKAVRHVEQLYFDMIACAEHFIYIENQFLTHKTIAAALNCRLKEKPELRILLISSYDPEGIMERKSMWHGRVLFRDILESGGVAGRVVMAYPVSRENGNQKFVRIHSKVMIIDDTYLRVGSSNLNYRSMAFDTECDLAIEAHNKKTRQKIASIRTDFICEHTGMECEEIEYVIHHGASIDIFLLDVPHSRQHLRRINDETYRHERFSGIATRLGDPEKAIISGMLTMPFRYSGLRRSLLMRLMIILIIIVLISTLIVFWESSPLAGQSMQEIMSLLQTIRSTPWGIPAFLAVFIVGSLVFFPVTVLITFTMMLFLPVQGFFIALTGSLISASIGFMLGRLMGIKFLRKFLGLYAEKVCHYINKGGIMCITILRMIPVAPFAAVNLALGMSEIHFIIFITATCLGLLPGLVAFSFLGNALSTLWRHPDRQHLFMAAAGMMVWIVIVMMTHFLARYWREHFRNSEDE